MDIFVLVVLSFNLFIGLSAIMACDSWAELFLVSVVMSLLITLIILYAAQIPN